MGVDGGGAPPAETGAAQAPKPEQQQTAAKETLPNPALTARVQAVKHILSDQRYQEFFQDQFSPLKKDWVVGMANNVDPAIEQAIREGHAEVEVTQPTEGSIDLEDPQSRLVAVWLSSFGAQANIGNNRFNVSPAGIGEIVSNPDIASVQQTSEDEIPQTEGTVLVRDKAGNPRYLIVETSMPGLRIKMEGSAILIPDYPKGSIKPSLLIETGNGKTDEVAPENEEEDLLNVIRNMQEQRVKENSQISDADLNNTITEFRTALAQNIKDPEQKMFLEGVLEELQAQDRSEITPEKLKLIDMAISKGVTTPEEKKRLRGLIAALLLSLTVLGKELLTGSGITRIPQSK